MQGIPYIYETHGKSDTCDTVSHSSVVYPTDTRICSTSDGPFRSLLEVARFGDVN